MIYKSIALPVVFLFLSTSILCFGQNQQSIPGEYLIQLEAGIQPAYFFNTFKQTVPDAAITFEVVSDVFHVFLIKTPVTWTLSSAQFNQILAMPGIISVQSNHILEDRSLRYISDTLPGDPFFPLQWQYKNTGVDGGVIGADLDAPNAWNINKGGLTAAEDSIVVAIIDGGFMYNHADLSENVWINHAEIPDDGIDNDYNGFVDDYRGWNVWKLNDEILGNGGGHGTPIAGEIGAKGNNGIGVTGINWNVKMMMVVGNYTEAQVLMAYDYVLKSRRLYNQTGGAAGAFVVAVNCSWGINYGQPSEAPIWCSVFDTLGQAGILSVAATANIPVNVDEVGDLPTACPSDFLISVTSLNKKDQKAPDAAWGPEHIHLGAYGQGIYSTNIGNGYGYFEGTSFAAPQVSGAIALLYNAPCTELTALAKINPLAAAKYARSLLLESTVPNSDLVGKTSTGGRLQLYKLLQQYQDKCSLCEAPYDIRTTLFDGKGGGVVLQWRSAQDTATYEVRLRPVGGDTDIAFSTTEKGLKLADLELCTEYEYAIKVRCAPGLWSQWSPTQKFMTSGCCEAPVLEAPEIVQENGMALHWTFKGTAPLFTLRFRPRSDSVWQNIEVADTMYVFDYLNPCADYAMQVGAECNDATIVFSEVLYFTSPGCGPCIELEYCTGTAENAAQQWIHSVVIGDWQHAPGISAGPGFQNFAGNSQQVPPIMEEGHDYSIAITPGFTGSPTKAYFRVYIDFNADGEFQETEIAYDPGFALNTTTSGLLSIPGIVEPGMSRMRVMMKSANELNEAPGPCETFDFGQVEDYCVLLNANVSSVQAGATPKPAFYLAPQPAHAYTTVFYHGSLAAPAQLVLYDKFGRIMQSAQVRQFPTTLSVENLPMGMYVLQLQNGLETQSIKLAVN